MKTTDLVQLLLAALVICPATAAVPTRRSGSRYQLPSRTITTSTPSTPETVHIHIDVGRRRPDGAVNVTASLVPISATAPPVLWNWWWSSTLTNASVPATSSSSSSSSSISFMVDGVGAQTNVFVNASHPYLGTLSSSVAIASGEAGLVAVQPSSGTLLDVFRIAIPDGDPCRWTSCVCGHETFSLGCLSGPLLLPAALRPCQGSTVECIVADGTNRTLTLAIPVTPLSNGTVSRRALNLVERAQDVAGIPQSDLVTSVCSALDGDRADTNDDTPTRTGIRVMLARTLNVPSDCYSLPASRVLRSVRDLLSAPQQTNRTLVDVTMRAMASYLGRRRHCPLPLTDDELDDAVHALSSALDAEPGLNVSDPVALIALDRFQSVNATCTQVDAPNLSVVAGSSLSCPSDRVSLPSSVPSSLYVKSVVTRDPSSSSPVLSDIHAVDVFACDGRLCAEVRVADLPDVINVTMFGWGRRPGAPGRCAWRHPPSRTWSTAGCTTLVSASAVVCQCTHLTEFALVDFRGRLGAQDTATVILYWVSFTCHVALLTVTIAMLAIAGVHVRNRTALRSVRFLLSSVCFTCVCRILSALQYEIPTLQASSAIANGLAETLIDIAAVSSHFVTSTFFCLMLLGTAHRVDRVSTGTQPPLFMGYHRSYMLFNLGLIVLVVSLLFTAVVLDTTRALSYALLSSALLKSASALVAVACLVCAVIIPFSGTRLRDRILSSDPRSIAVRQYLLVAQHIMKLSAMFSVSFAVQAGLWIFSIALSDTYAPWYAAFDGVYLFCDMLCSVISLTFTRMAIETGKGKARTSMVSNMAQRSAPPIAQKPSVDRIGNSAREHLDIPEVISELWGSILDTTTSSAGRPRSAATSTLSNRTRGTHPPSDTLRTGTATTTTAATTASTNRSAATMTRTAWTRSTAHSPVGTGRFWSTMAANAPTTTQSEPDENGLETVPTYTVAVLPPDGTIEDVQNVHDSPMVDYSRRSRP